MNVNNRNSIKGNKDFVSIVVPWFNRIGYFFPLVNSITEHADMPYELIIHDDNSLDGATEILVANKHNISTLILNTGHQLGLAASVNRCVEIAGSEYILFLNSDCIFNRPCFRDIVNVLNKPYVGWLGLVDGGQHPETINTNGTKFSFSYGIGSGCAFAFTKQVWEDIDGFDVDARSGCADSPFQYRTWDCGYFRAMLYGDQPVKNISLIEKHNEDSTIGKGVNDCNMPRLFNVDNYDQWCKQRWDACEDRFRTLETDKLCRGNTTTDMNYWHELSKNLVGEPGYISKINWDFGYSCGHRRYKEMIEGDFNAHGTTIKR